MSTQDTATGYGWFAASVASWFAAFGMQGVLFAWLVVGELRATPEWVGVAQMATTVPQVALLLVGGALAERRDPRWLLVRLHLVAGLPALALAAIVAAGQLSFAAVLGYGVAMGSITAFTMPARDTLLSRVAGRNLMRAVAGMTTAQFASQSSGTLFAGSAEWLGSGPVLCVQALVLFAGTGFALGIPRAPRSSAPAPPETPGPRQLTAGLRQVARSPVLRTTGVLVLAVGFLFIGPFLVTLPLLVRDFYVRGVDDLALVMMLFPLGTITGSLVLRRRGGIRRKVRATLLALAAGALLLGTLGLGLPFPLFLVATFCWGLAGSVFINASRTIYQQEGPASHRARVLSVYQLGLMGGAPLGSLTAGLCAGWVGPLATLHLFAISMLAVVGGARILGRGVEARV